MFIINRLVSRVAFMCLCSVFIGLFVVTVFSTVLSLYGNAQESLTQMTAELTNSPQNEKTLQGLARQLASESDRLSNIAPAAGR